MITMDELIEVRRDDTGTYEIPGAAEPELYEAVGAEMAEMEHAGSLRGWGHWTDLYRAVDYDGRERWFFGHRFGL